MNRKDVLKLNDPPNGSVDQLINAGIVAGFNFFTTLAGLGATGLMADPKTGFCAAAIAAGLSFFATLMTQRQLAPSKPK